MGRQRWRYFNSLARLVMKAIFIWILSLQLSLCDGYKQIFLRPEVIDYLHPESKGRSTLYLIKNDYCTINQQIKSIKIITVEEKEAVKHKNYIKIVSERQLDDKKEIVIDYPIEGATFTILMVGNKILNVVITES